MSSSQLIRAFYCRILHQLPKYHITEGRRYVSLVSLGMRAHRSSFRNAHHAPPLGIQVTYTHTLTLAYGTDTLAYSNLPCRTANPNQALPANQPVSTCCMHTISRYAVARDSLCLIGFSVVPVCSHVDLLFLSRFVILIAGQTGRMSVLMLCNRTCGPRGIKRKFISCHNCTMTINYGKPDSLHQMSLCHWWNFTTHI